MSEERIPKVSVIIPTYGGRRTLARAIESVLKQTYKNIEIIVVDDNPPESQQRKISAQIMSKYEAIDNIIYIQQPNNMERSIARNTGIKKSTGKYVMFLDDDDEFFEDKVLNQVEYMEAKGESFSCTYTGYINVDKNNKILMYCAEKRSGYLQDEALSRNLFVHAGSNLMVRRSVIDIVGGFNETINDCEDVEFLARLLNEWQIGYVDYCGLIVHIEPSISKNYKTNVEKYLQVIEPLLIKKDKKSKQNIIKRIQMQICRYDIGKKDLRSLRNRMKRYHISVIDLTMYIIHLMYRKITKKSCGYIKYS